MKKTVTINIRGSVFHIEEEAYQTLSQYLESLAQHFASQKAGPEILQDIESRIAEILQSKLQEGNEAITDEMVAEVKQRMGNPEDFMDDEEVKSERTEATGAAPKAKKRLYRDGENRVLGGVCSGMSAYFNIDPVFLRILFVLLIFLGVGVSVVVYLILWVVVPKAKTTAQRLEMRGEEATIQNIKKSVQEEMAEVKKSFAENGGSEIISQGKNAGVQVANGLGRVLAVVIGSFFIVAGFLGLIFFLFSVVMGNAVLHSSMSGINSDLDIAGMLGFLANPATVSLMLILMILIVGIPLLAILFVGTKMVFRYKTNNKAIGLGAFGIWLLAIIVVAAISVSQVDNFRRKSTATNVSALNIGAVKTLYVDVKSLPETIEEDHAKFDDFNLIKLDNKLVLAGHPEIKVEPSPGNDFAVVIDKEARGKNTTDIQANLKNIAYNFSLKDSTLCLDRFFTLENNSKWRKQAVSVTIRVPVGKQVQLSENLENMNMDIDNLNNVWSKEMIGKKWTMTADGLSLKQ